MKNYIPEEQRLVGAIKKQFKEFIKNSQAIDKDSKTALINEIGDNWHDDRFSGREFIQTACDYAIFEWRNQNLKVAKLWRDIVINNAKVNNEPHLVADQAIERYKEEFKVIDDE